MAVQSTNYLPPGTLPDQNVTKSLMQSVSPSNPTGIAVPNTPATSPSAPGVATYNPTGYTAKTTSSQQANSTGYTPESFNVTTDATVQGQLDKILKADSPLMQQARGYANQKSAERGLVNSSMAAGEAEGAMVDRALPVAQQDASTYTSAMTNTVNAKNAASAFGAQAENQASSQNAQLGTSVNLANADALNKAAAYGADAANKAAADAAAATNTRTLQLDLARFDKDSRMALATLDANNRQLIQQSGALQSLVNNAQSAIANISQNQNMTPEAKQQAVQTQMNLLTQAIRAAGGVVSADPNDRSSIAGLNLAQYFQDFSVAGAGSPSSAPGPSLVSSIPTGAQTTNSTLPNYAAPPLPAGFVPGSGSSAALPAGGYFSGDGTYHAPDGTQIPMNDPRNPYYAIG